MRHCSCGLAKWWGQQEFAIPQNVLEIVYGQTICWIGTFYSPVLPAICTIKYFIIFYIKKVTLCCRASFLHLSESFTRIRTWPLHCLCVGLVDSQLPSSHASVPGLQLQLLLPGGAADRPGPGLHACHRQCGTVSAQRISWNSSFSLLLSMFLLPCVYSFTYAVSRRITCSQACGPFVNYNTSWEVLPTTVAQLPHGVQTLLYALSSEAFAVSFFVVTWYVSVYAWCFSIIGNIFFLPLVVV